MFNTLRMVFLIIVMLVLNGCGGGGGGGDGGGGDVGGEPPGKTSAETLVNALYVSNSGSSYGGGTNTVRITVTPNSDSDLKVGFFENNVGGLGVQWKAAGWMAVTMIPFLLGEDPINYEISFFTGGNIDGASAGGLMTIGLMAAIRGDTINPQAAMTGTINPDGSIGPVGGIVHKIKGAADNGLTFVLVPEGQRNDEDLNTGKIVDLADWGAQLGVDVRFVANVYQAYELLTGASLPRPPAASGIPQVSQTAHNRLDSKAKQWFANYQVQRSKFDNQDPLVKPDFKELVAQADEMALKADTDIKQGFVDVGYSRAFAAALHMYLVNLEAEILTSYLTNGLTATITNALNGASAAETNLDSVISLLRTQSPSTVTDNIALVDAYRYTAAANGLIILAEQEIADVQANDQLPVDELVNKLLIATFEYALADQVAELARDSLDIYVDFGITPLASEDTLGHLAETLRLAADANLNYFETVTIDEYAKAQGVRLEVMQELFLLIDSRYLLAHATQIGLGRLTQKMGADASDGSYKLGNALATYVNSALTTTTWYALGATFDQNNRIVGITREGALDNMFSFAEQRANELISIAGEDQPPPAIVSFNFARRGRQSLDKEEQIAALGDFWDSAVLAHFSAYLSNRLPR